MPDCKLTRTAEPICRFRAASLGSVTLEIKSTVGTVQFMDADYNGVPIKGTPSTQITFDIVAGQSNLDVVYVFTDPDNGSGTLSEVCSNSTPLAEVDAVDPAVRYVICA